MSASTDSAILHYNAAQGIHNEASTIDHVVVQPGTTTSFIVGIFESHMPEPQLEVDLDDDSNIATSLERCADGEEYRLTYYFRSTKSIPCLATVRAY